MSPTLNPTPKPEALTLTVNGLNITGITHRIHDDTPRPKLLCLHGWLDNANSFLPMMPFLPNMDIVAIDMPGHGHSDHLNTVYTVPESAYWAAACIKALGWEQCHLVGHSLGGIIAPLVAVAMPEVIQSVSMIESSGALTGEPDQFVDKLSDSIAKRLDNNRYASKIYHSKQNAIDSRLRSATMAPLSAKLIVDRQLKKSEDGFQWRFDPKLRIPTAHQLTEAHVCEVNKRVQCPTLTVIANDGFLTSRKNTAARMALFKQHTTVELSGHHHLHMDTPEPVAMALNRFLGTVPDMGA